MLRIPLSLAAVLGAIVSAGCGGASREKDLREALSSVSERDLAVMVLPKSALGKRFASFEVPPYSEPLGYSTNAEEAPSDTIDPNDTGASLGDAGRVIGYDLTYGDTDLSALESGRGVVFVKTSIDLFRDDDSAGSYVEKVGRDWRRLAGTNLNGGEIDQVGSFPAEGVGEDAVGMRARITSDDLQVSATFVMFRVGRLVGLAVISRADPKNEDKTVQTIGRALAARIEAVLLGEIEERPVPLPAPE